MYWNNFSPLDPGESPFEGRDSLNCKIRPHVCDITDLQVDAIVCPTQTDLHLPPYGCKLTNVFMPICLLVFKGITHKVFYNFISLGIILLCTEPFNV